MSFLLFLVAVTTVIWLWARSAKRKRQEWLRTLNLLGKWELEQTNADSGTPTRRSFTLSGDIDAGTYVAKDDDAVQRGNWRVRGHGLTLEPTEGSGPIDGPNTYDLRLFGPGRIGLDGPGRPRETYVKRDSNVIPLRVRK